MKKYILALFFIILILPISPLRAVENGGLIQISDSPTIWVKHDDDARCHLTSADHYEMYAQFRHRGIHRWQDIKHVDTSNLTDSGVCSLRVGSLVRTLVMKPQRFFLAMRRHLLHTKLLKKSHLR